MLRQCLRTRFLPLIFSRGARTRRITPVPLQKPVSASSPSPSSTRTPISDIDDVAEQVIKGDGVEVELSPDLVLLDNLNLSRPGTKTDKRYQNQKALLKKLTTENEKTQSLTAFLVEEAKREILHYPNHDETEAVTNDKPVKDADLERGMEYELKQNTMSEWNVSNKRYKRFEILLQLLENFKKTKHGYMIVSVEALAQIFELSQYVEDDALKQRARYLSGHLIYETKKVEFDVVNESFYIVALMEFNEHKEAERLLTKRASKVGQRWWYELLAVNYVDQLRFDKAEEIVTTIHQKFGSYMDARIYLHFINNYVAAKNYDKAGDWVDQFKKAIESRGFIEGKREEPGLGASEEETLEFLNREDGPTKEEFLEVLSLYMNTLDIQSDAASLADFFIKQPGATLEDLAIKLLEFRLLFQTKILPLLQGMGDEEAAERLYAVIEDFRSASPLQSEQADAMDTFFLELAKQGDFWKISNQMSGIVHSEGKLSERQFYSLISALINRNRLSEAMKVLENLELSYSRALEDPDGCEQFVIPPVNAYHYLPFVRYFGRNHKIAELQGFMERFNDKYGIYNPALLTQLLSVFIKHKQFTNIIECIHAIIIKDIHRLDSNDDSDYGRLYSLIWHCLKDLATAQRTDKSLSNHELYPDYRVVFLKMIEDRVVPSATDYTNIVRAFIISFDYYPLPCILQYMGKIHQCTTTPEILRSVDRLYKKNDLGNVKPHEMSESYTKKLMLMEHERKQRNSLDPFSPQRQDEEEKHIEELQLQFSKNRNPDAQLLWRVALANVLDVLERMEADEKYLKRIHEQFGLTYDLNILFSDDR